MFAQSLSFLVRHILKLIAILINKIVLSWYKFLENVNISMGICKVRRRGHMSGVVFYIKHIDIVSQNSLSFINIIIPSRAIQSF